MEDLGRKIIVEAAYLFHIPTYALSPLSIVYSADVTQPLTHVMYVRVLFLGHVEKNKKKFLARRPS